MCVLCLLSWRRRPCLGCVDSTINTYTLTTPPPLSVLPPPNTHHHNSDQVLLLLVDSALVASALRQAGLAGDKVKAAIEKLRAGKKVDSAKAEQNYEVRGAGVRAWDGLFP